LVRLLRRQRFPHHRHSRPKCMHTVQRYTSERCCSSKPCRLLVTLPCVCKSSRSIASDEPETRMNRPHVESGCAPSLRHPRVMVACPDLHWHTVQQCDLIQDRHSRCAGVVRETSPESPVWSPSPCENSVRWSVEYPRRRLSHHPQSPHYPTSSYTAPRPHSSARLPGPPPNSPCSYPPRRPSPRSHRDCCSAR
jgi:hypothetical protein